MGQSHQTSTLPLRQLHRMLKYGRNHKGQNTSKLRPLLVSCLLIKILPVPVKVSVLLNPFVNSQLVSNSIVDPSTAFSTASSSVVYFVSPIYATAFSSAAAPLIPAASMTASIAATSRSRMPACIRLISQPFFLVAEPYWPLIPCYILLTMPRKTRRPRLSIDR